MRWRRQSGAVIETNSEKATVEHCEAQGWELLKEEEVWEGEDIGVVPAPPGDPDKVIFPREASSPGPLKTDKVKPKHKR